MVFTNIKLLNLDFTKDTVDNALSTYTEVNENV